MGEVIGGAFSLIFTLDSEVYEIIALTLVVTFFSTLISCILGIGLGVVLGSCRDFKGKAFLVRLINTCMGLPPVVVGLIVFLLLSREGPLGSLGLLFTPGAMIIAQTLLITPIVCGLTLGAVRLKVDAVWETCLGLGMKRPKRLWLVLCEAKSAVISAVLAGYGRAISEVGAINMVGGNILGKTRVMTTAIMLETGKGNFEMSLALGMILLFLSFLINWLVQRLQGVKI